MTADVSKRLEARKEVNLMKHMPSGNVDITAMTVYQFKTFVDSRTYTKNDTVSTIIEELPLPEFIINKACELNSRQENIKDALCRGITSINYMPITDKLVIKTDNYITAAKLASCKDVKDIFQHCFGTLNHLGLPAVLHKVIGIGNKTCQLTIGDYVDVAGENSVSFRTFIYGSDDLASFLAKFKAINPVMAIGGVASRHSGSKTNGGLDLRMAESLKDYNHDDDIICLQTVVITDYNWINGVLELFG